MSGFRIDDIGQGILSAQDGYEVEFDDGDGDGGSEVDAEEDDERHKKHIRVQMAKPTVIQPKDAIRQQQRVVDKVQDMVSADILSIKVLILGYFTNFVYDIIVNGRGAADITFALFLVVAFIVWLWASAYIRVTFASQIINNVLRDFLSFVNSSFLLLVVRYGLGVIDAIYINSTTSVWSGILVVSITLSLVFIVVYAFTNRKNTSED
jgi:hypothetical protein